MQKFVRKLAVQIISLWKVNLASRWRTEPASSVPMDVLIPAIPRDAEVVPLVIEGIRKNVRHPVGSVYLVGPAHEGLREVARNAGAQFVDEWEMLPLGLKQFRFSPRGIDRRGWILQQLIKLSGFNISSAENLLVVDADTVFVRAVAFDEPAGAVLMYSDEFYAPYFDACRKLLGRGKSFPFSFVAHAMRFERPAMENLHAAIEAHTGKPWMEAIIESLDPNEISGFSEYETYGNFRYRSGGVVTRYWENLSLPRHRLMPFSDLCRLYGKSYNSVSFHLRT